MSRQRSDLPWWSEGRPCVLVADPDPGADDAIRQALAHDAEVITCSDGAVALYEAGRWSPDVVLLSASLTVVPAADVAAVLAAHREQIRSIAVGVAAGETDRAGAILAAGADRLIHRPYAVPEVRSLLREHVLTDQGKTAELEVGGLRLDADAFRLTVDGVPVRLTLREFEILGVLMRHPDAVVPHAQLGGSRRESAGALSVHVRSLRRHVRGVAQIEAVRGLGYRLSATCDRRGQEGRGVSHPLTG